ncbi:hypothetical protein NIO06_000194 [Escherichia coli]|nr:hypothetical protein [Escherichia coli]
MSEYMSFWWSKFLVDIAITGGLFLIIFIIAAALAVRKMLKQRRCSHASFRETSACDAICNNCGKNLGFIGTVREKRKSTNG